MEDVLFDCILWGTSNDLEQLALYAENLNFYIWHGAKLSYVGGHFVWSGLRGKLGQPMHFRSELIHIALVQENVFSQMTYCKTLEHIWCCTHLLLLLLLLLFLSLSPPSFLFLLSNCLEYECNAPERQTRLQLNDLWGFGGFGQLACSRTGLSVVCVCERESTLGMWRQQVHGFWKCYLDISPKVLRKISPPAPKSKLKYQKDHRQTWTSLSYKKANLFF